MQPSEISFIWQFNHWCSHSIFPIDLYEVLSIILSTLCIKTSKISNRTYYVLRLKLLEHLRAYRSISKQIYHTRSHLLAENNWNATAMCDAKISICALMAESANFQSRKQIRSRKQRNAEQKTVPIISQLWACSSVAGSQRGPRTAATDRRSPGNLARNGQRGLKIYDTLDHLHQSGLCDSCPRISRHRGDPEQYRFQLFQCIGCHKLVVLCGKLGNFNIQ